ncbi:hypothetical protein [Lysinibacillus telephonicus]|uniref:hypothetical protein n=1 Tax=Lysinibacillus telephonicus TaxID=1714840 RepID=UPI0037D5E097
MENLTLIETGNWFSIISKLLIVSCLYFTLTFFQYLKEGDERLIKQSKAAAVVCLGLALLIPGIYFMLFIR